MGSSYGSSMKSWNCSKLVAAFCMFALSWSLFFYVSYMNTPILSPLLMMAAPSTTMERFVEILSHQLLLQK